MKKIFYLLVLGIIVILIILFTVSKINKQETHLNSSTAVIKKSSAKKASTKHHHQKKDTTLSTIDLNENLDNILLKANFNGTALIVKNNKILLRKGYGYANFSTKKLNTPNTLYLIASTQKAFIATSILQLDQQHKLSIDDPISKFLPHFPNGNQIKLRNFLTHTSSIVGRSEDSQTKTLDQMIFEIEGHGTQGPIGKWKYEDSNYTVLVKVLEKVTGESFRAYLNQHLFHPTNITQVGYVTSDFNNLADASSGYVEENNQLKANPLPNVSQLYGVGDMFMDINSMYKFDKALVANKFLDTAHLNEMFTPGSSSHYAMGFYNDPGLIINRGYLSGWVISNGFTHDGKDFILLFSNVKNKNVSLGKLNDQILGALSQIHG